MIVFLFFRRSRYLLKLSNSFNFKAIKPDQFQFCSGVQTNHKQMSIYWCAHLFLHPEPFRELFQKEGNTLLWGNRKCFPMPLRCLMKVLIQRDYWQKLLGVFVFVLFFGMARGFSTILSMNSIVFWVFFGGRNISTHLVILVHLVLISIKEVDMIVSSSGSIVTSYLLIETFFKILNNYYTYRFIKEYMVLNCVSFSNVK